MANQTVIDLEAVRIGIELLSKSSNAQDLCRRIALSDFMNGNCLGAAVYLLDNRSVLVEIASYGRNFEIGSEPITAWDDNLLAKAVRSRKVISEAKDTATVFALPLQHDDVATGVFVFHVSTEITELEIPDEVAAMLSSLGGLYMQNKGLALVPSKASVSMSDDDGAISIHELTSRQIQIIHLIADGLTNADIAKKVLLSESTVRQETIRIFRTLKCHSRSEAVVKSRALGIIDAITPPPPSQ